jgi:CheY-like chemotaxis protein
VSDTGIGIPADRLDRLFKSFSQVDTSTTRRYGGTGLGLVISKRLAELMGGDMWVESEVGKGSTFHFTIEAEAVASLAPRDHLSGEQPHLAGKRLLIVDDNPTNRRILVLQTKEWGMLARETGSPLEALKWLRRGDPFDLAILDMHMPEMDGIALAHEIHKLGDRQSLSLVMLSSVNPRETGNRDADFAMYMYKPIKQSQLYDALMTLFAGEGVGAAHPQAARRPAGPRPGSAEQPFDPHMATRLPLRILLAEDNAVNQKLALRMLGQNGLPRRSSCQRPGRSGLGAPALRCDFDGCADARYGWPGSFSPNLRPLAAWRTSFYYRHDRQCHAGRPRSLPGSRDGRLSQQANPSQRPGASLGSEHCLRKRRESKMAESNILDAIALQQLMECVGNDWDFW